MFRFFSLLKVWSFEAFVHVDSLPVFTQVDIRNGEVSTKYLQLFNQFLRCWSQDNDMLGCRLDEPFLHSFLDESQQRVVVAVDI